MGNYTSFLLSFWLIEKRESLYDTIVAYWENIVKEIIVNSATKLGISSCLPNFRTWRGKRPFSFFQGFGILPSAPEKRARKSAWEVNERAIYKSDPDC